jgi:hypothetical protein
MLEEVQLLVAGARPEIVAVDDEGFLRGFSCLVDNGYAALLSPGVAESL